jgi:hypothetical protein
MEAIKVGIVSSLLASTRRLTVVQAQDEIINMIKSQHPEWVQENDECPSCVVYEYELAEILR